MLREAVASIASKFGHEYYVAKAHADERTDELWDAVAEGGFLGVNVPEEYGGGGGGISELAAVQEELAAAGCPLLVIVVSPAICATIIAKFGTEAQKQRWLPRFATGELKMAFAITEPDAGSNSHNLGLTATKDGDLYRLERVRSTTSPGSTSARPSSSSPARGSTPTPDADGSPCSSSTSTRRASTSRCCPVEITAPEKQYTLFFDNVQVEADRLIGTEGEGLRQVFVGLNPERILSAATANGIGRYVLGKAAEYAKGREVWGTPIARHQGIAHPLAKAKIEVELARLMTDKAAWLCDHAGDTAGGRRGRQHGQVRGRRGRVRRARPGDPDSRGERDVDRVRPRRHVGDDPPAPHRAGQSRDDPQLRRTALARTAQVVLRRTRRRGGRVNPTVADPPDLTLSANLRWHRWNYFYRG